MQYIHDTYIATSIIVRCSHVSFVSFTECIFQNILDLAWMSRSVMMFRVGLLQEDANILDTLTGLPVAEDELLFCIPVSAPYSILINYK